MTVSCSTRNDRPVSVTCQYYGHTREGGSFAPPEVDPQQVGDLFLQIQGGYFRMGGLLELGRGPHLVQVEVQIVKAKSVVVLLSR